MKTVEIPLEFFKAIGEKPAIFRILWIKWFGDYAENLLDPDFIQRFMGEHKDKKLDLDTVTEAYNFGRGFFEDGFIFKTKNRTQKKIPPQLLENVKEVLSYLNELAETEYTATKANVECISARFKEGYTISDLKLVIENKVFDWKGTEQEKYLRPITLFQAKKFENYLHQPKPKSDGTAKSSIEKLSSAANMAKQLLGKIYPNKA